MQEQNKSKLNQYYTTTTFV